jgi:thiamine biosynthesis lipoprotein
MPADETERAWRAMGSDAVLLVIGGPPDLADRAVDRIEELEARWSRFRPTSEVNALNARPGESVEVSDDTSRLCDLAREAWVVTGGRFDPMTGGAVEAIGYDESFDRFGGRPRAQDRTGMVPSVGAGGIAVDPERRTARIPAGGRFDPGGLGKGLAADRVSDELLAAGADGVMISLGGDVRVRGVPPRSDDGWLVGIGDPFDPGSDLAVAALSDGGVATSSTLRRRWRTTTGDWAHHIVDPLIGSPVTSGIAVATVIAADAATAEVLATACIVGGAEVGARLVETMGAGAVLIGPDGSRVIAGSFEAFLVEPFALVPGSLPTEPVPTEPLPTSLSRP